MYNDIFFFKVFFMASLRNSKSKFSNLAPTPPTLVQQKQNYIKKYIENLNMSSHLYYFGITMTFNI